MNELKEEDLYSITPDNMRYRECCYCLCRLCMHLRPVCKNCWLCIYQAVQTKKCMWFVPFIFRRSPYKEWFRELELLRIRKNKLRNIDLLDFKG